MPWINRVLVVAGVTAESDELHKAMMSEAARALTRFDLIMPRRSHGPHGTVDAAFSLERALTRASAHGLDVHGRFGDEDPVIAAVQNFDPWRMDRIIVCTLPSGLSRWCAMDTPARVRRLTCAPVTHVQASSPHHAAQPQPLAGAAA